MDDGLKQRLVGAIVLLALAVIFLPVVFDREPMEPIDPQSQIPPPPEINVVEIPEPEAPESAEEPPVLEEVAEPEPPSDPPDVAVKPPAPEPQAPASAGEGKSWVLQVASFRSDKHASDMSVRLKELGFPAYTRKVSYKNGDITRVYIGPKLERSALQDAKTVIDRELKVDSIILAFTPG